jgi:hypothetical protein
MLDSARSLRGKRIRPTPALKGIGYLRFHLIVG